MKTRFSTVDIIAIVSELQKCVGMRVIQIYDVDSKTYLFKLSGHDQKVTLLVESGIRIHTTDFEWPKSSFPSGFSMKLRKHVKNKRLEKLSQLGVDRILDLQFGINEAAYHVILELYDRGNIVLTDYDYVILNILRPRTDHEDVKFVVREKYPVESARQADGSKLVADVEDAVRCAKLGDSLRKILLGVTAYGPALLNHVLLGHNLSINACIGKGFDPESDLPRLAACIEEAEEMVDSLRRSGNEGYLIQEEKVSPLSQEKIINNLEFHPFLYRQHATCKFETYPSFDKAVDNFFSTVESQKIDSKVLQKEKEAMKKLENVRKDHEKRISDLLREQEEDALKGSLIEMNSELVEKAILIIRSAIANQISWTDIQDLIHEAQAEGDPVAKSIKKLKLEINHITLCLGDPFATADSDGKYSKPQLVDIDLDLSAFGNARKYYDKKRQHVKKEQKTIEASEKAFRNAEKKTKETLKEVSVISAITKARKPMWFEKFIWFISSENYLVIAGRDIQQNELIVKRYMKPGDVYVHADIHGASSVVIKNPTKGEIPPKTLNEAGTLAVCYGSAWESKILTNAWWVYHHQVSKTAPTGEYLSAGSFMIRGKKNYLLPSHLILGFGFLFKLDEDSIDRHKEERRLRLDTEDSVLTEENDEAVDIEKDDNSDDESEGSKGQGHNEEKNSGVENDQESSESDQETGGAPAVEFPNTEVHLKLLEENKKATESVTRRDDEDTTLIIAPRRVPKIPHKQPTSVRQNSTVDNPESVKKDQAQPKRGKKGKLKKIKEKYKDQDEEERELKMKILASAGEAKGSRRKRKQQLKSSAQTEKRQPKQPVTPVIIEAQNLVEKAKDEVGKNEGEISELIEKKAESEDEEDDKEEGRQLEEVSMLLSLTGRPLPEDTLLYAIPLCAPYSVMQNYKYKVKVMPGTGRRGKAAKTALNIFLHDKEATQREKDCLRSVKDQDISRNFPSGKVKLAYSTAKKK